MYYRLSIFSITLPALRDRPEDLPLVIERILTRFSNQLGYTVELEPAAMEILKKYPWPGNIRELEAVLGRTGHAGRAGRWRSSKVRHLPIEIQTRQAVNSFGCTENTAFHSIKEAEYETILRAAQMYRGNLTHMAEALGIGRTTLWRKLKAFDIHVQEFRQQVH